MMKATLVILAAGLGTRFGEGIKQLCKVDPQGSKIIIDYSIHDAIAAGFDKIVFLIRRAIEAEFREVIGERIEKQCALLGVEVAYAYQELANLPGPLPEGRVKPFGTGHALLCCRDVIDGAFAVINADDYYGKESFRQAAEFLKTGGYGMVGYELKNTLSENGGVTRGICKVNENGLLSSVTETHNIVKTASGAEAEGVSVPVDSVVSMNFWCLPQSFINELEHGFPVFFAQMQNPLKDEYLLPDVVDALVKKGTPVTVMRTSDKWFGITYQEDKLTARAAFQKLYAEGAYKNDLYSDIAK